LNEKALRGDANTLAVVRRTHKQTHRQGQLQYTAQISKQCNEQTAGRLRDIKQNTHSTLCMTKSRTLHTSSLVNSPAELSNRCDTF